MKETRLMSSFKGSFLKRIQLGVYILLVIVLIISSQALAIASLPNTERILHFNSHITVQKNGQLTVVETIRVNSLNQLIRHGIYRDFPTSYSGPHGKFQRIHFELKATLQDGRPVASHTGNLINGVRIYLGDSNTYVSQGIHNYQITYQTSRQLGFFNDHDELYWNVTGNDWRFPIDQATAEVELPTLTDGQTILFSKGFTGFQGETKTYYTQHQIGKEKLVFKTTRSLNPQEGFTIAMGWSKGIIDPPSSMDKLVWWTEDSASNLWLGMGLVLTLGLFLITATFTKKRFQSKATIPLFHPPQKISPAEARYLKQMDSDNKGITAAIVSMAVQGYLKIQQTSHSFSLEKNYENHCILSREEQALEGIFGQGNPIELNQADPTKLSNIKLEFDRVLNQKFNHQYFSRNTLVLTLGIIILAIFLVLGMLSAADPQAFFFIAVFIILLHFGLVMLWHYVHTQFNLIRCHQFLTSFGFIGGVIGLTILVCIEIILIWKSLLSTSYASYITSLLLYSGIYLFFSRYLRTYTQLGKSTLDEINGFKMYLEVAEKDLLEYTTPPEKTPELFERYLPYAIALDVENQWAEKFNDVLAQASTTYTSHWYIGQGYSLNTFSFTSLSNGLSSSVASSFTAPGSTSGFSGSSGGGGGGGGGGGW